MDLSADAKRAFSLQSYAPVPRVEGVQLVDLARHVDDGGALTELGRLRAGALMSLHGFTAQQVTYSELGPGVIKAFTSTCVRPTSGSSRPRTGCSAC